MNRNQTCANCTLGHRGACRFPPNMCLRCGQFGHLDRFCQFPGGFMGYGPSAPPAPAFVGASDRYHAISAIERIGATLGGLGASIERIMQGSPLAEQPRQEPQQSAPPFGGSYNAGGFPSGRAYTLSPSPRLLSGSVGVNATASVSGSPFVQAPTPTKASSAAGAVSSDGAGIKKPRSEKRKAAEKRKKKNRSEKYKAAYQEKLLAEAAAKSESGETVPAEKVTATQEGPSRGVLAPVVPEPMTSDDEVTEVDK